MADLMMVVDTALAEVPVNLMPLLDDTDFKSREVAIVYNQAGMDLVWNFVTTAGAYTQTAVTPTTAGTYDWAHQGDGMYSIEIPASAGASINNDTEGFGWFTGFCTGVLPWRGPVIQFSPANVVNALVEASDKLQVHADEITAGLITAAAIATGAIDADAFAANAINAAKLDPDVTTELQNGLATAAALATVDTVVDAILVDTAEIGAAGAGLTALASAANLATVAGYLDTEIAAVLADTNELQTDWANGGRLDLLIDAIKAKTDLVPAAPAAVGDIPTAAANAAALMDLANGIETSITPRQALRLILAASAGKLSGAATTTIVIRNVGDSKDRLTATVDSSGNRSAVTVDAT
jgi:hypothetical protein